MTLNEIVEAISELTLEEILADSQIEGTQAYRVAAASRRYHALWDEAKEHGFVGVGIITYAENQLDAEGYTL
jgi:hypothetical protein